MTQLAPHQQRVVDEKRELDEKLQKLSAFISSKDFTTFVQNEAERGRLICQEETMRDYSAILAERIEAFGAVSITIPVVDHGPDSLEREIQAKALPPHQQRVLDEKLELNERLSKLDAFILDNPLFLRLPGAEQERLARQSQAMAVYSGILDERIACF